jgi:hypothetical protein
MAHVQMLSFGGLTVAWLMVVPTVRPEEPKEVKAIATAKDTARTSRFGPLQMGKEGVVIRSAEELVALTAEAKSAKDPNVQKEMVAAVAKLLKVDAIDWKKQMILGAIAEDITSMTADGKTLTANVVPFKEPLTRAIPKTPKILVLVERFEGEVKFVPKK